VVADAVDESSWRAESGGIVIADAVERGELSATTERLVRPPGARSSVETPDVAAPRARPIVVRARRPVIRAHAREKILELGLPS